LGANGTTFHLQDLIKAHGDVYECVL
jgi:hypothetical protein